MPLRLVYQLDEMGHLQLRSCQSRGSDDQIKQKGEKKGDSSSNQ
jgi:hypothetical protein